VNPRMYRGVLCVVVLLAACASERDHFYTLGPLPSAGRGALSTPVIHVVLGVTIPSLVDRSEMVIQTADHGIRVLDHQRWGEPFADQVSQTLARDLEQRRSDVLIGGRGFDQPGAAPVKIKVDIVRMSARMGGQATIEAHWRVENGTTDVIGGDSFSANIGSGGYAQVAVAYSEALSRLAEKLATLLPQ
jgi:uncharacterized lipoprotein YmbA